MSGTIIDLSSHRNATEAPEEKTPDLDLDTFRRKAMKIIMQVPDYQRGAFMKFMKTGLDVARSSSN